MLYFPYLSLIWRLKKWKGIITEEIQCGTCICTSQIMILSELFCFELPDIQQPLPDLSLYWQIPPLDHLSVLAYIWNLKRFKEMVKMNKLWLKLLHIYDNEGRFFMCGFLNTSLLALHCRQGLYLTVILMHYPSQFHCLTIYIVTWILSSPEPKAILNISCCSGLLIYHYLGFHMITWFFIPLPGCLYQHLAFVILLPGCLYDHYSSVGEDGRHIRGQEMNQAVETWQKSIYIVYKTSDPPVIPLKKSLFFSTEMMTYTYLLAKYTMWNVFWYFDFLWRSGRQFSGRNVILTSSNGKLSETMIITQ